MTELFIEVQDPGLPDVAALLIEHLASARLHSPPESVHALDVDGLRAPNITFWTARRRGELLGCAALKELDPRHGELKSMRTAPAHLRRGVAAGLLEHVRGVAAARGYHRLSLETGSMEAFAPARALYAKFGFERCGPFGDYRDDPHSVFMSLRLGAKRQQDPEGGPRWPRMPTPDCPGDSVLRRA